MFRLKFISLAMFALAFTMPLAAQDFVEGVHYTRIDNVSPPRQDSKIDVVEVFSYLCPHCNSFQPYVNNWHAKIPENVVFSRIPVVFQRSWQPYAVAYYTAENMGILEQSHGAMFTAIHREGKRFRGMQDIADFYAGFGVTAEQFLSTSQSFTVDTKLRRGMQLIGQSAWQIQSTPTVVVAGKYRVNASRQVPQTQMMNVVNFLVARETALMPAAEPANAEAADSE